ncbi:hypothetical protein PT2222_140324 [Paraburkholderia tropica]
MSSCFSLNNHYQTEQKSDNTKKTFA